MSTELRFEHFEEDLRTECPSPFAEDTDFNLVDVQEHHTLHESVLHNQTRIEIALDCTGRCILLLNLLSYRHLVDLLLLVLESTLLVSNCLTERSCVYLDLSGELLLLVVHLGFLCSCKLQLDLTNLAVGAVVLHHEDEGLVGIVELPLGVGLDWFLASLIIVEVVNSRKREANDVAVSMILQSISVDDCSILPISDVLLGNEDGMTVLDVFVFSLRVVVRAREDSEVNALLRVHVIHPGAIVDSSN